MLFSKKIHGFSLSEVLINMVLVAIISGCGYLAYIFSVKDAMLFGKANESVSDYVHFCNAFVLDEERCNEIERNDNKIELIKAGEIKVAYEFRQNYILRLTENTSDTFKLELKNVESRIGNVAVGSGLTDNGIIKVRCAGKEFIYAYVKQYDAMTLMRRNEERRQHGN